MITNIVSDKESEPPIQPAKAAGHPGHLGEQEGEGGGRTWLGLSYNLCKVGIY